MLFNNYWFDNDTPEKELERQRIWRTELLAAAVVAFFPEFDEFDIIKRIIRGCYEI